MQVLQRGPESKKAHITAAFGVLRSGSGLERQRPRRPSRYRVPGTELSRAHRDRHVEDNLSVAPAVVGAALIHSAVSLKGTARSSEEMLLELAQPRPDSEVPKGLASEASAA
jgi:hypothetical protein